MLTVVFAVVVGVAQAGPIAQVDAVAPRQTPPRVVLISGEDEYDSEASLSALAHHLATRHGMTTSLATSHSPDSVRGLAPLADADLVVLFVHDRTWPEADWKLLESYLARGRPLVALRTSLRPFAWPANSPLAPENEALPVRLFGSPWSSDPTPATSTDVTLTPRPKSPDHRELLRGVTPTFHVPSPLVPVASLADDVSCIARGEVVAAEREKGDRGANGVPAKSPALNPVVWIRTRPDGGRVFYSSMGHPDDFESPDFRRLLLNGIYWSLKLPVPEQLDTDLPVTKPLTDFQISTAYASDFSTPIHEQHFPPEEGIAGFNDVQWIPITTPDGTIDFRRFDPTSKQGTIYARSTLHLTAPHELELLLQSDDALELFVDKKSCFTRQGLHTLLAPSDRLPLTLPAGDHDLLFKVMNAGAAWALRARVRDLTEYRAAPSKPK